jgi:hypothetical protein
MEYLVTWAIDVDDETGDPREVAKAAMESFTRPGSIAHVFTVQARDSAGKPIGDPVEIDLDYP